MGRIGKAAEGGKARPSGRQMDIFLDALAESSNVAASARAAGVSANAMYRERRRNPGFAARWHEALIAPSGNVKDATLKSRAQKYRLGLSLLAAHRAAVRGGAAAPAAQALAGDAKARLAVKLRAMQARLHKERERRADGDDGF